MSATKTAPAAAPNPYDQIVQRLDTLTNEYSATKTAVEGLLKTVEQPASRAGLSPTEFLAKMTNGGLNAYSVAGDGTVLPATFKRHGRRLGTVRDTDGTDKNFGEYLTYWKDAMDHGLRNEATVKALQKFGTQRIIEGADGHLTKAALAESSGVTGGYTVPPVFSNQLLQLAIEDSIVRPRATQMPMTSRTLEIPSLDMTSTATAGTTPFLGGVLAKWAAEAQTRDETEPTFRKTTLTAWELEFYTIASNTLLADSAIGLDSLLTQLFTQAIAWYTDYAFFQGNGVGKPLGLINCPATISVTKNTAAHFYFPDVGAMLARFYWALSGENSVAWVIHQSVIGDLYGMSDTSGSSAGTGRLVFQPINQGAQAPIDKPAGVMSFGHLAGYPVLVTEKVPKMAASATGAVGLYDFSKYLIGTRMELQIDMSPHVRFLNNQSVWRCIWRGDGQPWLNSTVTLADGSHTVSPFVVLNQ